MTSIDIRKLDRWSDWAKVSIPEEGYYWLQDRNSGSWVVAFVCWQSSLGCYVVYDDSDIDPVLCRSHLEAHSRIVGPIWPPDGTRDVSRG